MSAFVTGLRSGVPDRPVVLAAGQGAFLYLLGDVVRDAGQRLRLLNLSRAQTLAAVRAGRAHLGVAVLDVLPDDLRSVPLGSWPQALVMPRGHPLARRRTVSIRTWTASR
jgi:DNA-binding transcriptional LysR family regulator